MVFGGGVRQANSVIYFNAILYNPAFVQEPDRILEPLFGSPILKTPEFPFDHTTYYQPEMGEGLVKYFAGYRLFALPNRVVDFKLQAVDLEDSFLRDGKRILNVDPGYVAIEKVVAASTKNFTHRIYLRDNIYADMQLMRRKGGYTSMPWTYEDYATPATLAFFEQMNGVLAEFLGQK